MRRARRSFLILIAGAAGLGGCGGGHAPAASSSRAAARVSPAHVRLVERRVEALRGLRFRHPVRVVVVSPAEARRLGLADERRANPAGARRAQEEALELLGLLPPGTSLDRIAATVYGEQVAGFYDPHRRRLALVRGTGVDDVTLAHELTHALEDQRFRIRRLATGGSSDAATAADALVEGTATEVMVRYVLRYPGAGPSLGAALKALTASGTNGLPPYILRSLLFPYEAGQRFVDGLLTRDGRDWTLVNLALRFRPPVSTAEVLHPARWLRVERPIPLPSSDAARVLDGRGWRRVMATSFGEEDTRELLHDAVGTARAARAAAGWRGGRLELWRRGTLATGSCPAPCRSRDVLVVAWRTSDRRTGTALASALTAWLRRTLHAHPSATVGTWRLPDGTAAAIAPDSPRLRLTLAPSATLAARLVRPPTATPPPPASS